MNKSIDPIKKLNKSITIILVVSILIILITGIMSSIHIRVEIVENAQVFWIHIILQLSMAYVSAFIFWRLTVDANERIRRKKYSPLIHDQLNELNYSIGEVLTTIGYDKAYTIEHFRQFVMCGDREKNRLQLSELMKKLDKQTLNTLYLNIPWDYKELELLSNTHDISFEIINTISLPLLEDNIKPLFYLFERMSELSYNLNCIASKEVLKK